MSQAIVYTPLNNGINQLTQLTVPQTALQTPPLNDINQFSVLPRSLPISKTHLLNNVTNVCG